MNGNKHSNKAYTFYLFKMGGGCPTRQGALKEIERTSHALDHSIDFRERKYLKCLFTVASKLF